MARHCYVTQLSNIIATRNVRFHFLPTRKILFSRKVNFPFRMTIDESKLRQRSKKGILKFTKFKALQIFNSI